MGQGARCTVPANQPKQRKLTYTDGRNHQPLHTPTHPPTRLAYSSRTVSRIRMDGAALLTHSRFGVSHVVADDSCLCTLSVNRPYRVELCKAGCIPERQLNSAVTNMYSVHQKGCATCAHYLLAESPIVALANELCLPHPRFAKHHHLKSSFHRRESRRRGPFHASALCRAPGR